MYWRPAANEATTLMNRARYSVSDWSVLTNILVTRPRFMLSFRHPRISLEMNEWIALFRCSSESVFVNLHINACRSNVFPREFPLLPSSSLITRKSMVGYFFDLPPDGILLIGSGFVSFVFLKVSFLLGCCCLLGCDFLVLAIGVLVLTTISF